MNNRKQRIIELFNMTVPNTPLSNSGQGKKKLAAGLAGSPAASIQPGLVAALTVIRFLGCNGNLFKMKAIELILEFSATTENHAHMVYRVASHFLFLHLAIRFECKAEDSEITEPDTVPFLEPHRKHLNE